MALIHGAHRAFTLVEVLSALVLLAILASVAAPNLTRAARRYAAWSAGHELRSDLVLARTRAVLDGATVRVVVDTVQGRYVVLAANGDTLRRRALAPRLLLRTTAWRQEILFTSRGTSSLYSTTWVGVAGDPDARWHGARVAPTGAVTSM